MLCDKNITCQYAHVLLDEALGDVDPVAFRAGLRTLLTTRLDSPLPSPATA
jgi:hypothetical protein